MPCMQPLFLPPPHLILLLPSLPCPQVLKFAVGLAYISTLVLSLTGSLPFPCFTSVIVAYGMAGEMVKLAEANLMSEWAGAGLRPPLRRPSGQLWTALALGARCQPPLPFTPRPSSPPGPPFSHYLQTQTGSSGSSSWPPGGTSPSAPCWCWA